MCSSRVFYTSCDHRDRFSFPRATFCPLGSTRVDRRFFPPPSRGFSYLYPFPGSAPTKTGFVQQISSPCLPPSAASSSPSQRLGSIDLGELCPSCTLNLAPRHFQESQSDGTAVTRSATAGHPYTWNCVALGFLCSFDARSTMRKSRGGFHES